MAATMPTLRPLIRRVFKEMNEFCPVTRAVTSCLRRYVQSTASDDLDAEPSRALQKKSSRRTLQKKASHGDFFETIGRRPSRALQLDDYHNMQNSGAASPASMDEESMVCADAVIHEAMGRQGRNPDGTLRVWSLQPIQMSPLRTSFFFANNGRQ